jgi:hypothetical protein
MNINDFRNSILLLTFNHFCDETSANPNQSIASASLFYCILFAVDYYLAQEAYGSTMFAIETRRMFTWPAFFKDLEKASRYVACISGRNVRMNCDFFFQLMG